MRGSLQTVGQNTLLDVGRHAVGVRISRPALVFDQTAHPTDLKRSAHFVEGVALIAHDLAGLGHVA